MSEKGRERSEVGLFLSCIYTSLSPLKTHTDTASPDEDSDSVCSSQDSGGSVTSTCEDGVGVVLGGVEEEILEVDMDLQLSEYIDQLSDKK